MKLTTVTKLCFATGLSLSCSFAGTPTIGVASAFGAFRVDDVKVEGNANVFSGSQMRTDLASSRVYLQNGAALTLGTYSTGKLYKDHLVLEQGSAKVEGANDYGIEAGALRIKGMGALSTAVVRWNGPTVQVAALAGSLRIQTSRGVLLSRIDAGAASEFSGDASGAPGQSGVTAGQSGATADQSGATADQSGATAQTGATSGAEEARRRRRREAALYLTLGTVLGGLGLAVDAILQPGAAATSP